jgi:phosphomannomutase/phosphoglucomutase
MMYRNLKSLLRCRISLGVHRMISEGIFRAYDIRGVYGKEITEDIVKRIGRALAEHIDGQGKTMLVGRDVRMSGKPLSEALSEGMLSGGLNVEDIGIVTTPLLRLGSLQQKRRGHGYIFPQSA